MPKKSFLKIILIAVILSLGLNILIGRWVTAKISTLPVLNRWKLLSPQAPIVITNREEIRVSDTGDVVQAIINSRSKLSEIALVSNGQVTVVGSAINLTGEGVFVTAGNVFTNAGANYYVITSDGRTAQISGSVQDPATGLIFFNAAVPNLPVAALGNSGDLKPGEKVIFLNNSPQDSLTQYSPGFVTLSQNNLYKQIFDTDHPSRAFGAQESAPLLAGQAIVNTNSEIVGVWDGNKIISSDVLKNSVAAYFQNPAKILRPSFGFTYSIVTKTESSLLNQPEGALVKNLVKLSAASQAGLQTGDIITNIDGAQINETSSLEEILQRYKIGDKFGLSVTRANQALALNITAGELK